MTSSKISKILLLIIFLNQFLLGAQTNPNDCINAIKICGNGEISSNAEGMGKEEIENLNSCGSLEHNSLWLYIEITKEGTLGFDLIPNSSETRINYDFYVFGPNASCSDLKDAIRCSALIPDFVDSTSNITGMSDNETDTSEPIDQGNGYLKSLNVKEGESYYILIDRHIGEESFKLKWTGTSTIGGLPFPNGPEISKPDNIRKCNAIGEAIFDLNSVRDQISDQHNITISYHKNRGDAFDNKNQLTNQFWSNIPEKEIYVRVKNNFTDCFKITSFTLVIDPGPPINLVGSLESCDIDNSGTVMFDLSKIPNIILTDETPDNFISYFHSKENAINNIDPLNSLIETSGETIYTKVSNLNDPDCYNIAEIELILNAPPQVTSYEVVQPQVNSNLNTLTLNIPENLDYEYSIGNIDGPYQTGTTFTDVESGFQTLYIRDKKGCAIIEAEIAVLGYDTYFTPNNDGIHDKWQIKGIKKRPAARILSIFLIATENC